MVKVIGLCGSMGAGKDVVAKYLVSNYGYTQFTIGDIVREEMTKKGIEITREKSDAFSEEMRSKHGQDYFIKQCVEKIKSGKYKNAVMDGIRLPSDTIVMEKGFGKDYVLFKVDALPLIRFERLQSRGRSDLPKTLEQFKNQEKVHNKEFKLDVTFKKAAETIDNSGTLEALYENIKKVAKNPKYKDWF